jgi:hypothetical protein
MLEAGYAAAGDDDRMPHDNIAADLQTALQRFYAEQMQLLDDGGAEAWADTFTDDGVFAANGQPAPVRGRHAIAAAARAARDQLGQAKVVHRHWLGMLTADLQDDGSVRARCYALVIATPHGGVPAIHRSTLCEDVLIPADGSWRVRSRIVTRDDLTS